jgi:transcriptional regulator GlxA family with amidase domain
MPMPLPATTATPPASIFVLAYAECDELDVVGPMAVLQTANQYLAGNLGTRKPGKTFDLKIVSVAGAGDVVYRGPEPECEEHHVVTGIHGITIETTPWDGNDLPDVLIVAGGNIEPGTGIMRQKDNPAFTGVIRRQYRDAKTVVSVCTGAFGLAGAGIADGRHVTTHPGCLDLLIATDSRIHVLNPDWDARVVEDGLIISCGGVTSGINEALYLVQKFWPHDPQLISDVRGFVDFQYQTTLKVF